MKNLILGVLVSPLAVVRSPQKAQLFDQSVETHLLDLECPETLASALHGVDRALLLTGY
ncbi:hypothetical protein [Fischerella sp. JS2]|uniref:hypothetical protein n=1 Tax=Fischerella sp. JS2 TaxID=2597771 RepID=UPI0028EFDCD1|nr:hypothetical protein [Fischerella sp. JS2]